MGIRPPLRHDVADERTEGLRSKDHATLARRRWARDAPARGRRRARTTRKLLRGSGIPPRTGFAAVNGDWLSDRRSEAAEEKILDAAGELFARERASTVGMKEIARAAGCSRATLYRYFENREVLLTAYTEREGQRVFQAISERVATITDPRDRLVEAGMTLVWTIRAQPGLSSWFTDGQAQVGGRLAQRSRVIRAFVDAFVRSLGVDDPGASDRRARWVIRVVTSILVFPGRDDADERAILEEFVAPLVAPLP